MSLGSVLEYAWRGGWEEVGRWEDMDGKMEVPAEE